MGMMSLFSFWFGYNIKTKMTEQSELYLKQL